MSMMISTPNKTYSSDGQFIFSCQYHVIFCPKYRRKVLNDPIAKRLKELVLSKQSEYGFQVLDMEVMEDHVHLLLSVNPKVGIYKIVSNIKGFTSYHLRQEFKELTTRLPTLWTHSRFISSVGSVSLDVVKHYIEDQKNK